jgi:hypothetical protein
MKGAATGGLEIWISPLVSSLKKGKWTLEEDDKLIEAAQRFGKNWVPVTALRWYTILDQIHSVVKDGWTV